MWPPPQIYTFISYPASCKHAHQSHTHTRESQRRIWMHAGGRERGYRCRAPSSQARLACITRKGLHHDYIGFGTVMDGWTFEDRRWLRLGCFAVEECWAGIRRVRVTLRVNLFVLFAYYLLYFIIFACEFNWNYLFPSPSLTQSLSLTLSLATSQTPPSPIQIYHPPIYQTEFW